MPVRGLDIDARVRDRGGEGAAKDLHDGLGEVLRGNELDAVSIADASHA